MTLQWSEWIRKGGGRVPGSEGSVEFRLLRRRFKTGIATGSATCGRNGNDGILPCAFRVAASNEDGRRTITATPADFPLLFVLFSLFSKQPLTVRTFEEPTLSLTRWLLRTVFTIIITRVPTLLWYLLLLLWFGRSF